MMDDGRSLAVTLLMVNDVPANQEIFEPLASPGLWNKKGDETSSCNVERLTMERYFLYKLVS